MTSFKISKGLEQNLPEEKTDGMMYFCTDTGNIYIDYSDDNSVYRKLVNLKAINDECAAVLNSARNYASSVANSAANEAMSYASSVANSALTQSKNYTDNKTNYYGLCETAADIAAKTVRIDGFELKTGAMVLIKFKYSNSASKPTLNVNETGDIPLTRYGTTSIGTDFNTNSWNTGAVQLFVYDGTNWIRDYWSNPTYANGKTAGTGYGTCTTAAATTAKTAAISNYAKVHNGIVSIKFNNDVPANATLNISSKGAMPIYYQGAAISNGIIKAGDTATFIAQVLQYGSCYHLISIDRQIEGAASTITDSNLTSSRVLISNGLGKVAASSTTSTELGYLRGVTSSIQTQLDDKAVIQMITWGDDD